MTVQDLKTDPLNVQAQLYIDFDDSSPLFQANEAKSPGLQPGNVIKTNSTHSQHISYHCLLVPYFPAHKLDGDLADWIKQWLMQICASHDWRLEFTTVHPDYLQWGLMLNDSITPSWFIQTMRAEISQKILSNFGHILQENFPDDFWAPGHVVVLGKNPYPSKMIPKYISLIRRQQGFE